MPLKLDQFVTTFSSNLYGLYSAAQVGLRENMEKPPRWLRSYLIFAALEKCRRDVRIGLGKPSPYCRFSLGKQRNEQHPRLDNLISRLRTLRAGVGARPLQLSEYLVDFTFSVGTLQQGRGDKPLDNDAKFELLLGCESELASDFSMVLEDCLKLLDVKALVKVMVFRSITSVNTQEDRKTRLTRLFNAHGPEDHQAGVQWLFLGIPIFADWRKEGGEPAVLQKQVYTFEQGSYNLVNQSGWTDAAEITHPADD